MLPGRKEGPRVQCVSKEAKFLAREYLALWKGYGVEGLPADWNGVALGHDATPAPELETAPEPPFRLMFVGDSREGLVGGASGELLGKILDAMGQARDAVALLGCGPNLETEIAAARPHIIVALGQMATQRLLGDSASLAKDRGNFQPLSWDASIRVLPTYPPNHLLRTPEDKKVVWEDMKKVMHQLSEA